MWGWNPNKGGACAAVHWICQHVREPAAGTESNMEVLASGALGWGTRTHSFIQQSGGSAAAAASVMSNSV